MPSRFVSLGIWCPTWNATSLQHPSTPVAADRFPRSCILGGTGEEGNFQRLNTTSRRFRGIPYILLAWSNRFPIQSSSNARYSRFFVRLTHKARPAPQQWPIQQANSLEQLDGPTWSCSFWPDWRPVEWILPTLDDKPQYMSLTHVALDGQAGPESLRLKWTPPRRHVPGSFNFPPSSM